jgi:hypothetical protein
MVIPQPALQRILVRGCSFRAIAFEFQLQDSVSSGYSTNGYLAWDIPLSSSRQISNGFEILNSDYLGELSSSQQYS